MPLYGEQCEVLYLFFFLLLSFSFFFYFPLSNFVHTCICMRVCAYPSTQMFFFSLCLCLSMPPSKSSLLNPRKMYDALQNCRRWLLRCCRRTAAVVAAVIVVAIAAPLALVTGVGIEMIAAEFAFDFADPKSWFGLELEARRVLAETTAEGTVVVAAGTVVVAAIVIVVALALVAVVVVAVVEKTEDCFVVQIGSVEALAAAVVAEALVAESKTTKVATAPA